MPLSMLLYWSILKKNDFIVEEGKTSKYIGTFLVSDATATFNKKGVNGENYSAELIDYIALASLNEEFATIITTAFLKQNI